MWISALNQSVSSEGPENPSLLAYPKYGCRSKLRLKFASEYACLTEAFVHTSICSEISCTASYIFSRDTCKNPSSECTDALQCARSFMNMYLFKVPRSCVTVPLFIYKIYKPHSKTNKYRFLVNKLKVFPPNFEILMLRSIRYGMTYY